MLEQLMNLYDQFLAMFPATWHGPISLLLTFALAAGIWSVIKKSGIWLLLLILLVPALIPTLKGIGEGIVTLFKFLLDRSA